jgi:hypothetical protein
MSTPFLCLQKVSLTHRKHDTSKTHYTAWVRGEVIYDIIWHPTIRFPQQKHLAEQKKTFLPSEDVLF